MNCKYAFTGSLRNFVSESYVADRLTTYSPKGQHDAVATINGVQQPLYQAQIDIHANTLEFVAENCKTFGPNSHYMIRNDRAVINNPVMEHYGSSSTVPTFGMSGLVYVGETATKEVIVNDAVVTSDKVSLACRPRTCSM